MLRSTFEKLLADTERRREEAMRQFYSKYETDDGDDEVIDLRILDLPKPKKKAKKGVQTKQIKFGEMNSYTISKKSKTYVKRIKRCLISKNKGKTDEDSDINCEIVEEEMTETVNIIRTKRKDEIYKEDSAIDSINRSLLDSDATRNKVKNKAKKIDIRKRKCLPEKDQTISDICLNDTIPLSSKYNPYLSKFGLYYPGDAKIDCLTSDYRLMEGHGATSIYKKIKNPFFETSETRAYSPQFKHSPKLEALHKDLRNRSLTDKLSVQEIFLKSTDMSSVRCSSNSRQLFPKYPCHDEHLIETNGRYVDQDYIYEVVKNNNVKCITTKKNSANKSIGSSAKNLNNEVTKMLLTQDTCDINTIDTANSNKSVSEISNRKIVRILSTRKKSANKSINHSAENLNNEVTEMSLTQDTCDINMIDTAYSNKSAPEISIGKIVRNPLTRKKSANKSINHSAENLNNEVTEMLSQDTCDINMIDTANSNKSASEISNGKIVRNLSIRKKSADKNHNMGMQEKVFDILPAKETHAKVGKSKIHTTHTNKCSPENTNDNIIKNTSSNKKFHKRKYGYTLRQKNKVVKTLSVKKVGNENIEVVKSNKFVSEVTRDETVKNLSTKEKSSSKNSNCDAEIPKDKVLDVLLTNMSIHEKTKLSVTKYKNWLDDSFNYNDTVLQKLSIPLPEASFSIHDIDKLQERWNSIPSKKDNTLPDNETPKLSNNFSLCESASAVSYETPKSIFSSKNSASKTKFVFTGRSVPVDSDNGCIRKGSPNKLDPLEAKLKPKTPDLGLKRLRPRCPKSGLTNSKLCTCNKCSASKNGKYYGEEKNLSKKCIYKQQRKYQLSSGKMIMPNTCPAKQNGNHLSLSIETPKGSKNPFTKFRQRKILEKSQNNSFSECAVPINKLGIAPYDKEDELQNSSIPKDSFLTPPLKKFKFGPPLSLDVLTI